jgi:hypothetical protein
MGHENAFVLYFVAVIVPIGGWLYFSVEGLHHMTPADVPRSQNAWVANRIIIMFVEAVIAAWLVPIMPHGNLLPWTVAAVLFAQSAYFTSKARRQFLDWIAESRDTSGNK